MNGMHCLRSMVLGALVALFGCQLSDAEQVGLDTAAIVNGTNWAVGGAVVGPMTQDELRRAIEEPARAVGLAFEPGLVDAILGDVGGEPGHL